MLIGSIIFGPFGDLFGRIPVLRFGLGLSILIFAFNIYYQFSLVQTYVCFFGLGLLSSVRLNLGFIYGAEVLKEKQANVIGSLALSIDSFTMIIASIFFMYISKNWLGLYSIYFFLLTIPFFISFLMPESPRYLL